MNFRAHVQVESVATRDGVDKDSLWYSVPSFRELFQETLKQLSQTDCLDEIEEIAGLIHIATSLPTSDGKTVDIRRLLGEDASDCSTRRHLVAEAVDAILDIQVHQMATGNRDPDVLAEVSRKYSQESQYMAQLRATLPIP